MFKQSSSEIRMCGEKNKLKIIRKYSRTANSTNKQTYIIQLSFLSIFNDRIPLVKEHRASLQME